MEIFLFNHVLYDHNSFRLFKMNRDGAGFRESKRYSNRKNFKRNQRRGL